MEETTNTQEVQKLSYEELNKVALQLQEQNQKLREALQEAYLVNTYKRLDYLFKVVENGKAFDVNFTGKCIEEIVEIMNVNPEKEEK